MLALRCSPVSRESHHDIESIIHPRGSFRDCAKGEEFGSSNRVLGELRAGADAQQQRVLRVAQLLAHFGLERLVPPNPTRISGKATQQALSAGWGL